MRAGGSVRKVGELPSVFQQSTKAFSATVNQLGPALLAFLTLFLIHQLFLWVDKEPEVAFERAALLFEVTEVSWDTTSIVWNSGADIVNAGVLPLWNSFVYYAVEPGIVLVLEIFSLIFLQSHWEGFVDEESFPYNGFDCLANEQAARWCGSYAYYNAQLQSAERAPYYVNDSATFGARRLSSKSETFVFGPATARRLSQLGRRRAFQAPVFDTATLTDAIDSFSDFFLTTVPGLLDLVFGVFGNLLETSFSVIFDGIFFVLKNVVEVFKMLIKSGMISTVIGLGVDFLVIGLVEVMLPSFFAALDLLMCMIDYLAPAGWSATLPSLPLPPSPPPPSPPPHLPARRLERTI